MTYIYEIETRNGTVDYEFHPTHDDVKSAIIDILSTKSGKELYDIMEDIAGEEIELEDYFEDELHEYFEEPANERYEEMEQRESDYRYDYYHDKL